VPVEVTASHTGLAFDPRVADVVVSALGRSGGRSRAGAGPASVLEVDGGVTA
jgi:hypothetical protein